MNHLRLHQELRFHQQHIGLLRTSPSRCTKPQRTDWPGRVSLARSGGSATPRGSQERTDGPERQNELRETRTRRRRVRRPPNSAQLDPREGRDRGKSRVPLKLQPPPRPETLGTDRKPISLQASLSCGRFPPFLKCIFSPSELFLQTSLPRNVNGPGPLPESPPNPSSGAPSPES